MRFMCRLGRYIIRLTVVFMMRLLLGEWSESDFSGGWFLVCLYSELPAGKMVSGQCSAVVTGEERGESWAGAQWSDNREQGVYFCNHSKFNLLPFLLPQFSLSFSQSLLFDSFQRSYPPLKRFWILACTFAVYLCFSSLSSAQIFLVKFISSEYPQRN